MRVRAEDSSGDMTFGNGELNFFINDIAGVAQVITTRLRLWQGEWFLDTDEGTPLSASVLGKNKLTTAEPAIVNRILGSPLVTGVPHFSLAPINAQRGLTMTATATTAVGSVTLNEIF